MTAGATNGRWSSGGGGLSADQVAAIRGELMKIELEKFDEETEAMRARMRPLSAGQEAAEVSALMVKVAAWQRSRRTRGAAKKKGKG